jgi:hypothetical protein
MLLTRKSTKTATSQSRLTRSASAFIGNTIDRRTFLKRSGLATGGAVALSQLPFPVMRKAQAADKPAGDIQVKRTICTHCSVGCAIDAVVQNGVWIRQEPVFDSPINLGAHCATGAAIREHGMTEHSHRLKQPSQGIDLTHGVAARLEADDPAPVARPLPRIHQLFEVHILTGGSALENQQRARTVFPQLDGHHRALGILHEHRDHLHRW